LDSAHGDGHSRRTVSVPSLKGDGYYYFSYNSGLQSQAAIYRVKKGEESDALARDPTGPGGELFFDVRSRPCGLYMALTTVQTNLLSTDGTIALSSTAFSKDGKYFAYAISKSGSDWTTIYVRETSSPHKPEQKRGTDEGRLNDVVRDVKFSSSASLAQDA
jgi:prolyl oligopeptidase